MMARSLRGSASAAIIAVVGAMGMSPAAAQPPPQETQLLVHLPGLPVEAANRAAAAVTSLTESLSAALPGLSVEVKLFRRLEDVHALYQEDPQRVAFVLAEPALLRDLNRMAATADAPFEPRYRFVRDGGEEYRRLLVVRMDRDDLSDLSSLEGKTLTFVPIAGATSGEQEDYLDSEPLRGAPSVGRNASEFFQLRSVQDDFSAVANVVFQQTDAALVAEHNPLLQRHLGSELKVLYTTAALSLPTLAVARGALTAEHLSALDDAIARLRPGSGDPSRQAMAEMKLDRLATIAPLQRLALLGRAPVEKRRPEIALPPAGSAPNAPLELPDPAGLSFGLAVELPEVPIPTPPATTP